MEYPKLKECLNRVGFLVSPRAIHLLNGFLNYLNIGRWFHDRGLSVPIRLDDRAPFYQYIATQIQEPASFLEFGVFKGASLRQWTELLKNPSTFLHGFDSFVGLPENWRHMKKEIFDAGSQMPKFEDSRVKLFKGWFSDTLPVYLREFKPHPCLIVHLDADLYSSTSFVLTQLRSFFSVGTILIFDEIYDREHELKAFSEFMDENRIKVECIAATRTLTQAAFRITALGLTNKGLNEPA
ncbi:MAG TPA: TylF/MycF/NovP-related O-methyltransferase [Verrucomicrobiae bacterium]|nr:TylF/MycF/NovP-related O-methyltransferase [Verrucomicrobiae bacterium]